MSEPLVEVRDLAMTYAGEVQALQGVSFSVPRGQVCGYLGPNGAGKSTTLKILAGLLRPTSGTARIAGHDLASQPVEARRRIGYLPETGALYPLLSPAEHLALVADLHELDPDRAADRADRLLDSFGIADLVHRRIDTLSKGQRQRVALAGALLHEPDLLILDEPLTGLDVGAARRLKELIGQVAARGGSVLYCSHVLEVVERVCGRTIILHRGRIVADGPTAELVGRSRDATLESLFHELTGGAAAAELADAFTDFVVLEPEDRSDGA